MPGGRCDLRPPVRSLATPDPVGRLAWHLLCDDQLALFEGSQERVDIRLQIIGRVLDPRPHLCHQGVSGRPTLQELPDEGTYLVDMMVRTGVEMQDDTTLTTFHLLERGSITASDTNIGHPPLLLHVVPMVKCHGRSAELSAGRPATSAGGLEKENQATGDVFGSNWQGSPGPDRGSDHSSYRPPR